METPGTPKNEHLRLGVLQAIELLDSEREDVFDSLTDAVRLVFDVPICAFSLIDDRRQWFKSIQGLSVCETSRDFSFCGHVVFHDKTIVVPDTLKDPRFADNPLVTQDPFIRFYAGSPVRMEFHGNCLDLGSLCLIDRESRSFSHRDVVLLEHFAKHVETLISANLVRIHLEQTCEEFICATRSA